MAATTAWLQHISKGRPVAVKHKAREDSGAHPKHARAERWTGGATEELVVDHSKHDGVGYRRRRRSGFCSGGTDQLKGHRAPAQHGKDETKHERSRKLPELAGHGDAHSTVMLSTARKKGNAQRFSVESGFKDWSAGFAKSRRSYDMLC